MNRIRCILGALSIVVTALAIFFVCKSESTVLIHPKGIIANQELDLMATNTVLMLIIIVPTYVLL